MGMGRREGGRAEGGASSTTVGGGGDGSLGSSAGNGLCPLHETSHMCSDREVSLLWTSEGHHTRINRDII